MFKNIKKAFYLTIGTISLITGIIGIFLPLLPTTCFLLLTAICYERGSDKFHNWLINHPYFGPPIIDWQRNKVIRTKYKVMATSMMVIGSYFIYFNSRVSIYVAVSYTIFMILILTYIWTRKSNASVAPNATN